jgi:hypothetical protein
VKDVESTKVYQMFRGLLIWHSSYFAAALDTSNELLECKGNTIELEEDIAVFDVFYCWLYTGQLKDAFISQDPTNSQPVSADDVYLSAITLCKIWVFADFRGIPALGNAAINMLHERIVATWINPSSLIKYVYGNTTKGSKLREFLLHFFTRSVGVDRILETNPEHFTVEYTLEVLAIVAKSKFGWGLMMRDEWTKINRCQWHDHSGPGGQIRLESRK